MRFISSKTVTIRKAHRCWGCGDLFPPKTQMTIIVGSEDGRINTTYWCEKCREVWNKEMRGEDEIDMGDLKSFFPEYY